MIIYSKLLLMAIFWGGTFVVGRTLAQTVGPFAGAFFRFAIAAVFLLVLLRRAEGRLTWPQKGQMIPVILLGLTGALLYNFFFLKGLKMIEAGRASVIIANNPIFIALFSGSDMSSILAKKRVVPQYFFIITADKISKNRQ